MKLSKKIMVAAALGALGVAAAAPAMADITPYGSIRIATFWDTQTGKYASNVARPETATDFDLRNQNNSRLGVKFSDGKLQGHVELGIGSSGVPSGATTTNIGANGAGANTAVYTRLAYGTYKFNAGTLLVGQTYNPYLYLSQQVARDDINNIGYGALWDGRQPQIKFTTNMGIYVAAIRSGIAPDASSTPSTTESYVPKLTVGYDGKIGNVAFTAGVLGQVYKDQTAGRDQKQIYSALGYAHGKIGVGPATIGFNFGAGQNLKEMGFAEVANGYSYNTVSKKIENTYTISSLAEVGVVLTPVVKVNAGAGYVWTTGKAANGQDWRKADNKVSLWVNAPITLAKGVTIVPEISYEDNLNESVAFGSTAVSSTAYSRGQRDIIYGAKWQYDF